MIHYSFPGYMVASAIIMLICVIAYRILLENKVRPSVNRVILLLIYAVSFFVPLIVALLPETSNEINIEIGVPEFGGVLNDQHAYEAPAFNMHVGLKELSWVYYIGVLLTFIYSIFSVGYLVFLLKKADRQEIDGLSVHVHDNKKLSSFSWYNKIFLYKESLKSDFNDLQILLAHEEAHLERRHWIDLSLAQFILIFQWFNPAGWFIRRELQRVHEYEADESVLLSGVKEKDYQMLLIQNISGNRYSGLTDGLNNCSLKKRIIMMKKTKFKKDWVTRGIAVCGFAVLGGLIIQIPAVADVLEVSDNPTKETEKIIALKGDKDINSRSDAEVSLTGSKSEKETLASVNPANPSIQYQIKERKVKEESVSEKETLASVNPANTSVQYQIKEIKVKDESVSEKDQSQPQTGKYKGEEVYNATQIVPMYGGSSDPALLMDDLLRTIRYPENAHKNNIQGRVVVKFIITKNGTLEDYKVVRPVDPELDEAAINALKALPKKWTPGYIDGKPVNCYYNLPVTFKLK